MIEWMITKLGALVGADVALILLVMWSMNIVLTSLSKGLEVVKDKTETDIDNKAHKIIGQISKVLLKILDGLGYNPAHKK